MSPLKRLTARGGSFFKRLSASPRRLHVSAIALAIPVPWKIAAFSLLRWSVHALHMRSRGQHTQEASTNRVTPFSRIVLSIEAAPSSVHAEGTDSAYSTVESSGRHEMNLSNSGSHPSESLQRHTKTPMRRSDVSCGPGGENEMPWPFMRGALSPSSRTASAAAAKPRSVMAKMSGLMALELYARISPRLSLQERRPGRR